MEASIDLETLDARDKDFVQYVNTEINEFLNSAENLSNAIMLFPPFNGYLRMLTHNLVESSYADLSTFSIGAEPRRRIVICRSSLRKFVLGDDSADKTPRLSSVSRPKSRPTLTSDVLKVISRNLTPVNHGKTRSTPDRSNVKEIDRSGSKKEMAENQQKSNERQRKSRRTMSYYVPPHLRKSSVSESEPAVKKEKIDDLCVANSEFNSKPANNKISIVIPSVESVDRLQSLQTAKLPESSTFTDDGALLNSQIGSRASETVSMVEDPIAAEIAAVSCQQADVASNFISTDSSASVEHVYLGPLEQEISGESSDVVPNCEADVRLLETSNDCEVPNKPFEQLEIVPGLKKSFLTESTLTDPKSDAVRVNVVENGSDWDPLYCGKGTCSYPNLLIPILDSDEMGDIESEVGRVSVVEIKGPPQRVDSLESAEQDADYVNGSIVEIYDLPDNMRTEDLAREFETFVDRGLRLRWVDQNTALGIFASSRTAEEVLSDEFESRLKIRPISEGNRLSQEIARHIVLPSSFRPKTCSSIAKRLLSGALGLKVSPEEMAAARQERIAHRNSRDQRKKPAA